MFYLLLSALSKQEARLLEQGFINFYKTHVSHGGQNIINAVSSKSPLASQVPQILPHQAPIHPAPAVIIGSGGSINFGGGGGIDFSSGGVNKISIRVVIV